MPNKTHAAPVRMKSLPGKRHRLRLNFLLPIWSVAVIAAVLLTAVGVGSMFAVSSDPQQSVPAAVLDAESARTAGAAESVRRSMNEAVDDLQVAKRTAVDGNSVQPVLDAITSGRSRYRGAAWLQAGTVSIRSGEIFDVPMPWPPAPVVLQRGTLGHEPLVLAGTSSTPEHPAQIVGWYDAAYLNHGPVAAGPGSRWLVNSLNQVIGSNEGFIALQDLPFPQLVNIATAARNHTARVHDDRELGGVVSASAVEGNNPAGSLGWVVVSLTSYSDLQLTNQLARDELRFAVILMSGAAWLTLGWFILIVASPLRRLSADATRIAEGDVESPVQVERYDEIGVIARNIDRLRRTLRGDVADAGPVDTGRDEVT